MSYFVLDAREGGIARLVDDEENEREVLCKELPCDAAEGDCLLYEEGAGWQVDRAETEARRQRLKEKRLRLLKRNSPDL